MKARAAASPAMPRGVDVVHQHPRQRLGVELDRPAAAGRAAHVARPAPPPRPRAAAKRSPGFGSSARSSASMSSRSSASTPQRAISSARRPRAASARLSSSAAIAGSSRSRSRSCSARHSSRSRAPDPGRIAGLHQLAARRPARGRRSRWRAADLGQRHPQVAVVLELVGEDQRRLDRVRPRRASRRSARAGGRGASTSAATVSSKLPSPSPRRAVAAGRRRRRRRRQLQQRVLLDLGGDVVGELEVRHLQQLDRLLQLRRHHQRLVLPELDAGRERHQPGGPRGQMRKLSPRYTRRTLSSRTTSSGVPVISTAPSCRI